MPQDSMPAGFSPFATTTGAVSTAPTERADILATFIFNLPSPDTRGYPRTADTSRPR